MERRAGSGLAAFEKNQRIQAEYAARLSGFWTMSLLTFKVAYG